MARAVFLVDRCVLISLLPCLEVVNQFRRSFFLCVCVCVRCETVADWHLGVSDASNLEPGRDVSVCKTVLCVIIVVS